MEKIPDASPSRVDLKTGRDLWQEGLRRASREIDIEDLVEDYFETQVNYSRQSETKIYGLFDRMDLNQNGFLNLEEFYRVLDPKGNSEDDSALYFNEADAEAFLGPHPVYTADFESLDGQGNGGDFAAWVTDYTLLQSLVTFLQEDKWFGKIEVRPAAIVVQDDAVTDSGDKQVDPYDDADRPLSETAKEEEASEKFVEVDELGLPTEKTFGLQTLVDVMKRDYDMTPEDFVAAIIEEDNEEALIAYAQGAEWDIASLDDLSDLSNEDIGELSEEFFMHSLAVSTAELILKSPALRKFTKSL